MRIFYKKINAYNPNSTYQGHNLSYVRRSLLPHELPEANFNTYCRPEQCLKSKSFKTGILNTIPVYCLAQMSISQTLFCGFPSFSN